eukprot:6199691-Pleurochrysis_carterae.AAC.1
MFRVDCAMFRVDCIKCSGCSPGEHIASDAVMPCVAQCMRTLVAKWPASLVTYKWPARLLKT